MDKQFTVDCIVEIETEDGDFETYSTVLIVGAGWNPGYRQTLLDQGESRGYEVEWVLLAACDMEMVKHLTPYASVKITVGIGSGYFELPAGLKDGDQIYIDEPGITQLCQDWLDEYEQGMAEEARREAIYG